MPETKAMEKTIRETGILNQAESINPAHVCISNQKANSVKNMGSRKKKKDSPNVFTYERFTSYIMFTICLQQLHTP